MAATILYDSGKRVVLKDTASASATASALFVDASALVHAQHTLTLDAGSADATLLNVGDRIETAASAKAFKIVGIPDATTIVVSNEILDSGVVTAIPANGDDFVFNNGVAVAAGTIELHAATAVAASINALAHKMSITRMFWTISGLANQQLLLDWEASSDVEAVRLIGGGDWNLAEHGVALKNLGGAGVNGDINLTLLGAGTIDYTLIIECKKELNFGTTIATNNLTY